MKINLIDTIEGKCDQVILIENKFVNKNSCYLSLNLKVSVQIEMKKLE